MEVMAGEIEENKLWKKTLDQGFDFQQSLIGSSSDVPKHVLIVMNALKEFSIEQLEWALKNVSFEIMLQSYNSWHDALAQYSSLGEDMVGHLEREFSRTSNHKRKRISEFLPPTTINSNSSSFDEGKQALKLFRSGNYGDVVVLQRATMRPYCRVDEEVTKTMAFLISDGVAMEEEVAEVDLTIWSERGNRERERRERGEGDERREERETVGWWSVVIFGDSGRW
ncbi:hypothetical protein RND71_012509 [Anisodus tanguticus]|uniref:Uncharacterized protein n=1 Tax=Anisodus tanguticus TaxID=243964 RepID=A0AAE1SFW7_9SOLA|nr:hypothetical protein RND71_012509 [Anisodus tanguticus]